jgi:hypothetical protein
MPADAAEIRVGNGAGKIRLLSLHDIDRRTAAYRRTVDLIEAIEGDLGGADQLSTGQRQIVQRLGLLCTLSEHLEAKWLAGEGEFDPALYVTISNALKRLFEIIGIERKPRDVMPTLQEYLRARERAPDTAEAAP